MNPLIVGLVYGLSLILAATLLWEFHTRWYWHVLSVAVALAVGLYKAPEAWRGPWLDVVIGCAFVFFFFWGAGEIMFHTVVHHRAVPRS